MNFAETLATLPTADHLRGLDVLDADGAVVHHIPAAPGKMGSLRIYHAMAQAFDGQLSAAAIAQGLAWGAGLRVKRGRDDADQTFGPPSVSLRVPRRRQLRRMKPAASLWS